MAIGRALKFDQADIVAACATDREISSEVGENPKLKLDQIADAQADIVLPHHRAEIGPGLEIGEHLIAFGEIGVGGEEGLEFGEFSFRIC
jgi:hypothetical protein